MRSKEFSIISKDSKKKFDFTKNKSEVFPEDKNSFRMTWDNEDFIPPIFKISDTENSPDNKEIYESYDEYQNSDKCNKNKNIYMMS